MVVIALVGRRIEEGGGRREEEGGRRREGDCRGGRHARRSKEGRDCSCGHRASRSKEGGEKEGGKGVLCFAPSFLYSMRFFICGKKEYKEGLTTCIK